MKKPTITIFELLDNFFGSEHYPTTKPLNNRQIRDLREHVLDFYNSFVLYSENSYKTRLYLGGFLSAPPFTLESSPYISSALLYSDSIILFDPLHYLFCEEQYSRERLLSAPTGWKNLDTNSKNYKRPDYNKSKLYLAHAFSWLYSLRPLIETGKIILIPAEKIVFSHIKEFKENSVKINNLVNAENLSDNFSPEEITVDDNRKGAFVFSKGKRKSQIRHSIKRGIEQFTKDLIIANATKSIYTAPFRWEQYLGSTFFNEYAATKYHTTIVEGIRNLRLPILANLSPYVLNEIHQDSGFSNFRKGLQDTLQQIDTEIGSKDFEVQARQIEQELLIPQIESLFQEVNSSRFQKITKAFSNGIMSFGQDFIINSASGMPLESNIPASVISGAIPMLQDILSQRKASPDKRIWTKLLPEKHELPIYGSSITLQERIGDINGWNVPTKTSNTLSVTTSIFKFPWESQSATDASSQT